MIRNMDTHLDHSGTPHSDVQALPDNKQGSTAQSASDAIPPNAIPQDRRQEAERAAQIHRANSRIHQEDHARMPNPSDYPWNRAMRRLGMIPFQPLPGNDAVDEADTEYEDGDEDDFDDDDDDAELENLVQRRTFPVTLNSSSWRPAKVECIICQDDFSDESVRRLLCGHAHCDDCIKANARSALNSNPFSPAKCCHVIPKETLSRAGAFTDDEAKRYSNKMEELTNPHYKLYCWGEGCGAFIPLVSQKKRVGECEQCGKKTCKACRQKSHFGPCNQEKLQDLRNSEDLVYKLAENKGWKRCPNCLNIVQKHGGCNHMACHCGQGFCYACGHAFAGEPHVCPKDRNAV